MNAAQILDRFLSVADWVDRAKTVDRVIIGDPKEEIHRVLVSWMSDFRAVRAAVERQCQLLITHEPTFWTHANELQTIGGWDAGSPEGQIAAEKRRFVEKNGLAILRIHDVWDGMPEVGIPWAWARFLGLAGAPAALGPGRYQQRYDIAPLPLDSLALQVAERTAAVGEPAVQVMGDGERSVSKVGIGTGCYCSPLKFMQMGCDVSVVCDDGSTYWADIQCAVDAGHAIIRVNHGTSEEVGMVALTQYINERFPGIAAEHLPHGCCFRLVGRC
jgi:putative NIF3 family GTP cyclohydrolase 1 type 2